MTTKTGKSDIVNDFREARARLHLNKYDRYLVEHIAGRVARLLGKRDACEPASGGRGTCELPAGARFQLTPSRATREQPARLRRRRLWWNGPFRRGPPSPFPLPFPTRDVARTSP